MLWRGDANLPNVIIRKDPNSLQASFHIFLQPTVTHCTDPDVLHDPARIQEIGRGCRGQAITKTDGTGPIHQECARKPIFISKLKHRIQRLLFINK